jgi:hypothetical protein
MTDVSRTRRRRPAVQLAAPLLAVGLVLGACSGDEEPAPEETASATPTATAPEVEVPEGVELTEAGTELRLGEPAAVVFQAGPERVSTLRVAVTKVVRGSMERDFTNFDLSDQQLKQVPYYVTAKVTNTGPTPLGGATAPVWALDSEATYFPPTSLVGNLPACPGGGALPKPFAADDSVTTCLLFIAEPGTTVQEVQLRPYEGFEPVSWAVPESVEQAAERRDQQARERDRGNRPGGQGGQGNKPRAGG